MRLFIDLNAHLRDSIEIAIVRQKSMPFLPKFVIELTQCFALRASSGVHTTTNTENEQLI